MLALWTAEGTASRFQQITILKDAQCVFSASEELLGQGALCRSHLVDSSLSCASSLSGTFTLSALAFWRFSAAAFSAAAGRSSSLPAPACSLKLPA